MKISEVEKVEIDTEYTRNITCPYCGKEMSDSWEVNAGEPEFDNEELDCGRCEKTFIASRDCSITYSTRKKEE
jgi:transcription elongation factor Elf1